MPDTKLGTFNDLLKITPENLIPIIVGLKELILSVDPSSIETVRLGDRAATYGVGPKKMKEGYCYLMPHKSWVNLGFYQGGLLNDETKILEGTGKKLRHIKIRTIEEVNNTAIKNLIQLAFEERKKSLTK